MDRTRDLIHTAPDKAKGLSVKQREALLLLDPEQPTRSGQGIPGSRWKELRNKLLARSDAGEVHWFATALGVAVQEVIRGEHE